MVAREPWFSMADEGSAKSSKAAGVGDKTSICQGTVSVRRLRLCSAFCSFCRLACLDAAGNSGSKACSKAVIMVWGWAWLTMPARPASSKARLTAWRVKNRSEEHTSELQSLMRISYAVFCLQKKTIEHTQKYK